MITEAYPLQWPSEYKRTIYSKGSQFGVGYEKPNIGKGRDRIISELKLFGATNIIISSNLKLRLDGFPYANQRQPNDKGVAVYFTYKKAQKVMACDTYDKVGCNLWGISKSITALRGLKRWGCTSIVDKAFKGFTAIPETTERSWWEILEVVECASAEEIKKAYRKQCKITHPDIVGDDYNFKIVQAAYYKALNTI